MLSKTEWILGTWENKTARGSIYETWVKKSSSELAGKSYMIKQGDTVTFETIRIIAKDNELYYIPAVKNQNDGIGVSFKRKNLTDSEFLFENLEHDSPNVIRYQKISDDELLAEIWTYEDGKTRKTKFPMKRIK